MTKKLNKRGFTIVELVVVIVVIAILAAVLIPTVSSLIGKANQSADTSAVRQMNEQLAITEVEGKPANIGEAIKALLGVNIKLENYTPLATNTQFYWVKSLNRVVYVNIEGGKEEILYPNDLQDLTHENGDWYSLNGDIEFADYSVDTADDGTKSVNIASAGQFAQLASDWNDSKTDATAVKKITLTEDIDLQGSTIKFFKTTKDGSGSGFNSELEINGGDAESPKTIYGFRDDEQTIYGSGEYANKGYGYGLFGNIGKDANVTIKNVVFEGITVEDTANEESSTAGLIAGYIYGTLKLENVTFKNCSVTANQKVGAICGNLCPSGSVTLTNVQFTNTVVSGGCETAKLVGYLNADITKDGYQYTGASLTVTGDSNDFSGITVCATVETFTKDAFTLNSDYMLYSDATDNTFKYVIYEKNANNTGIYNVTTNDWAWYRCGTVNTEPKWNGVGAANYGDRHQNCFMNGISCSASCNFKNGKPDDNNSTTGE